VAEAQITPAHVEIRVGQAEGTRHELHARTVIGRSTSADLPLDHVSVSRRHAELVPLSDGRWLLKDLGSRNGTSVNGQLISERVLGDGDQISIGEMTLRFSHAGHLLLSADAEDAPGFTITSLNHQRSSRVSADHVAAIVAFGRALQGIEQPELAGWWSYALRVSIKGAELDIRTLCPPAQSAIGASRTPHVSKSVLRAASQTNEPVMPTTLPVFSGFRWR
jgi:sigma-B regulation protein RsbU (phosphoserine phosphatase)